MFKLLSLGRQNFGRRGVAAWSESEVIRTLDVLLKNKKFDLPLQGKNHRLQVLRVTGHGENRTAIFWVVTQ